MTGPKADDRSGAGPADRRLGVLGTGYVGLTTAACLAELGHRVTAVDSDRTKIEELRAGQVPIDEPELDDLVRRGLKEDRLRFDTAIDPLLDAEMIFICLPTPPAADGHADLGLLESTLATLVPRLAPSTVLVIKSTVPAGTTSRLAARLRHPVISNPEFLREGRAVHDFLQPDRIVIGADDPLHADALTLVYAGVDAPVLVTRPASAELIKHASNAFLAIKISYANEVNELALRVGARTDEVLHGIGADRRIGFAGLTPGPGWGGSCLPKDTLALTATAGDAGAPMTLVEAAIVANDRQQDRVAGQVRAVLTGRSDGPLSGLRLAVFGLAFKAGTADLRESPALAIARRLADAGAQLVGYDPAVTTPARTDAADIAPVRAATRPEDAVTDADGIVLLTEWPQFRHLDWPRLGRLMRRPIMVDARNLLDPEQLRAAGFGYHPLGRTG
jgi:UDPglucose 6-dehydrogenase